MMRTLIVLAGLLCCASASAQAPNSCLKCHAELEGDLATPVAEWKTSIHFENGISCSDCHGGDPLSDDPEVSMDPDKGFVGRPSETDVPDFCGKCHSAVRDNFVQSAHFKALGSGMGPNCVSCHTAHRQQKVTLDLINEEACGQCHSYEQAAQLKETMRDMEVGLVSLEHRNERLFMEGLDQERERKELFALRNETHRLTHVLDISRIQGKLKTVQPGLQRLGGMVGAKEKTVRDRKTLGTALMGFFLVGAMIAWGTHAKLKEETVAEEPAHE